MPALPFMEYAPAQVMHPSHMRAVISCTLVAAAACIPCAEGEERQGDRCVRPCNRNLDCLGTEHCEDGVCTPGSVTPQGSSSSSGGASSGGGSGTSSASSSSATASSSPGTSLSASSSSSSGGSSTGGIGPGVTVNVPIADAWINIDNAAAFAVEGTCREVTEVDVTVGALTATTTCNNGSWATSVNAAPLADGVLTFKAVGTSNGSGVGNTVMLNLNKDTIPPGPVTFTSPAADTVVTTTEHEFSWSADASAVLFEHGLHHVAGCGDGPSATGFVSEPRVSVAIDLGIQALRVTALDLANNRSVAACSSLVEREAEATLLTIVTPADGANLAAGTSANVAGACQGSAAVALSYAGGITGPVSASCTAGTYSASMTLPAGPDLYFVEATQAGSTGTQSVRRYFSVGVMGGVVVAATQFGSASVDQAYALELYPDGDLIMGGGAQGNLGGGGTGVGAHVTRVGPDGAVRWKRQVGANAADVVYGLRVAADGFIYAAGVTHGSLGATSAGGADAFIIKLDGAGNVAWSDQVGSSADDAANGLALDEQGYAWIVGSAQGSLPGNTHRGQVDPFVARYSPGGARTLLLQLGTNQNDSFSDAVGVSGGIMVVGYTSGSLTGFINAGLRDVAVHVFDFGGMDTFHAQYGTPGDDVGRAVSLDAQGNRYVGAGTTGLMGPLAFGGGDLVLMKLLPDNTRGWTRQLGTNAEELALSVYTYPDGTSVLVGYTWGNMGGLYRGGADAVVVEIAPDGATNWIFQTGSPGFDFYGAVSGAGDTVYLAGATEGALAGPSAGNQDVFFQRLVR